MLISKFNDLNKIMKKKCLVKYYLCCRSTGILCEEQLERHPKVLKEEYSLWKAEVGVRRKYKVFRE